MPIWAQRVCDLSLGEWQVFNGNSYFQYIIIVPNGRFQARKSDKGQFLNGATEIKRKKHNKGKG